MFDARDIDAGQPGGGPFTHFRRDHAGVLARLAELESRVLSGPRDPGDPLLHLAVEHLEHQFATHMAAEDAVLYPALVEAFPACSTALGPLRADHDELRLMLASLAARLAEPRSSARDEQVFVQVRDLVDLLRLHIHREETAVFDVASRALSPAEIDTLAGRLAPYLGTSSPDRADSPRRQKGSPS